MNTSHNLFINPYQPLRNDGKSGCEYDMYNAEPGNTQHHTKHSTPHDLTGRVLAQNYSEIQQI